MILVLKERAVKKSRWTEEQIIYALKQVETGTPVAEALRGMAIQELGLTRFERRS